MSAIIRVAVGILACAVAACASPPPRTPMPQVATRSASLGDQAIARGRHLTSTACASCHATGATGESPLTDAPPLREIVHRYPLDHLEQAFAEGLVTAHPAMPAYIFRASEIDDLIAYLETLRADS